MLHTSIVTIHVVGAVAALISGVLAVRFPNGTPRHRGMGKLYVTAWVVFGTTGIYLGAQRPGISPFEVLNVAGALFAGMGIYSIRARKRLGTAWKRLHYRSMLISYAFVAVATLNQILIRLGFEYPLWVFFLIAVLPFPVLIPLRRRLDARYAPRA